MFRTKTIDGRSFFSLAANQMLFQLGHSLFEISLIWLVLDLTGSRQTTGLLAAAVYLPFLIFSLPAGIYADGRSKVTIIRIVCFLEALFVLAIPLLEKTGFLTMSAIGISAFILTSIGAFYSPARDSLIPLYLPEEMLLRGNTVIQTSIQIAFVLGPVAAGFLIDGIGALRVFTVIGGVYLVSFIFGAVMRHPVREKEIRGASLNIRSLAELGDVLRSDPVMIWLLFITIIDNLFIMGPAIVGMAIMVRDEMGGSASDWAMCETFLALGMITASAVLLKWGRKIPLGPMLIIGIIMDGLTYIPVKWAPSIPLLWAIIFLHALFIPLITVSRTTITQKRVPMKLQGRFFSLISISVMGLTAVSTALTGVAAEYIPIRDLFMWIGIFAAATGGTALFYRPLRHLR